MNRRIEWFSSNFTQIFSLFESYLLNLLMLKPQMIQQIIEFLIMEKQRDQYPKELATRAQIDGISFQNKKELLKRLRGIDDRFKKSGLQCYSRGDQEFMVQLFIQGGHLPPVDGLSLLDEQQTSFKLTILPSSASLMLTSPSLSPQKRVFDVDGFFINRISSSKQFLTENQHPSQMIAQLLGKAYKRFPMMQSSILKHFLSLTPHPNSSFLVIADFFNLALGMCDQSQLLEETVLSKLFQLLCQLDIQATNDDETFFCIDFCLKKISDYFSSDKLQEERLVNIMLKITETIILPVQSMKFVPYIFVDIAKKSNLFLEKLLSLLVLNGFSHSNIDLRLRKRNLNYMFSLVAHCPGNILSENMIQTILKYIMKGLSKFKQESKTSGYHMHAYTTTIQGVCEWIINKTDHFLSLVCTKTLSSLYQYLIDKKVMNKCNKRVLQNLRSVLAQRRDFHQVSRLLDKAIKYGKNQEKYEYPFAKLKELPSFIDLKPQKRIIPSQQPQLIQEVPDYEMKLDEKSKSQPLKENIKFLALKKKHQGMHCRDKLLALGEHHEKRSRAMSHDVLGSSARTTADSGYISSSRETELGSVEIEKRSFQFDDCPTNNLRRKLERKGNQKRYWNQLAVQISQYKLE